jgi:deoxyribonuclease V
MPRKTYNSQAMGRRLLNGRMTVWSNDPMAKLAHRNLHPWNLEPQAAIALQQQLAQQLDTSPSHRFDDLKTIAGVDVSVKDGLSRAAIVILTVPDLTVLEISKSSMPTPFPYIPGLLSFREGEVILKAYAQLTHEPDLLMFDGQGIAHPRRLGIAAHIGLWLERPTIGCAKSWLIGKHAPVGTQKGDFEPMLAADGDVIGVALRTRTNVKPVFVSPGHRCDIDSARRITLAAAPRYRLPEPTRAAHNAAGSDE